MDAQNLRKTPLMSRWECEQFDFSFENLILRVRSCLLQYVELRKMTVNKMVPTVSFGGSYSSWIHSHWPQSSAQNESETFVVEFCMCECVYNNLLQILYQNWHRQHIVILERNIIRWETTLSKQNPNISEQRALLLNPRLRHSGNIYGILIRGRAAWKGTHSFSDSRFGTHLQLACNGQVQTCIFCLGSCAVHHAMVGRSWPS